MTIARREKRLNGEYDEEEDAKRTKAKYKNIIN